MGYRILADIAALDVQPKAAGRVEIADPHWSGYLANVPAARWTSSLSERVPETLGGAAFLERYAGTTDEATVVEPERTYAVRTPTAHAILESDRIRRFRKLLEPETSGDTQARPLGNLMAESHTSYGACGLGSEATDRLAALIAEAGEEAGLFGAKITGGGRGGTLAVLARRGAESGIRRVATLYSERTGRPSRVVRGSSPGAMSFGTRRLVF